MIFRMAAIFLALIKIFINNLLHIIVLLGLAEVNLMTLRLTSRLLDLQS